MTAMLNWAKGVVKQLKELNDELEDDARQDAKHERRADKGEDYDDTLLCSQCNGSGEGMHERTSCYFCKGRGTV